MQDKHRKQINSFIENGQYDDAKEFLIGLAENYKNDKDFERLRAHVYRKLNELKKAEEFIQNALDIDSQYRPAVFEAGLTYQAIGNYEKAVEFLERAASAEGGDVHPENQIDILNSLALTYKKMGETEDALHRYNLALQLLAKMIYHQIEKSLQPTGYSHTEVNSENWYKLAIDTAAKEASKDGVESISMPTGESAMKYKQENKSEGKTMYDKDGKRYLLPPYFEAFFDHLKSDVLYASIVNNIATLYAEEGEGRKAREYFNESIEFIPEGVNYPAPRIGLKELNRE